MPTTESHLQSLVELETALGTPVLVIYLGDRPQLETRLAQDIVPPVYEQLDRMGHAEKLHLLLYTRGGDTLVPLRLISLLREYCHSLNAIVHHRAHSAGTLLCIGCDSILLSPLGELSPIDPSISSPFTPKPDGKAVDVSIEDVIGYFQLAADQGKLKSEKSRLQVFQSLTEQIHPLALGSISRTYLGIREIAHELLAARHDPNMDDERQKNIIDALSTKLRFHGRPISRNEAIALGLYFVQPIPEGIQELVARLHLEYASYLGLGSPFNPEIEPLTDTNSGSVSIPAAILESRRMTHTFEYSGMIMRGTQPPESLPPGIQLPTTVVKWTSRQWQKLREE